jgi:3-deoxy-manno-octulosonate cytidylyltransferase (CMP-KDO synthetase)
MKFAVVIPARHASSRLPGKPLVKLCGVEMIVRTYRRCAEAVSPDLIHVATDDARIAEVCRSAGIQCLMTSSDCLTGTDRVAEAAARLDADVFINVQGDEPVFNPEDLRALIAAAARYPGEVINGYCVIEDEALFRSGSTPKVVTRPDGRLLYMSRAPIPTGKGHEFSGAWRQVCAYAFPRAALEAFASCREKTRLERVEDIEILRFLELGMEVRMIPMSDVSVAVDQPGDIARAERAIAALGDH